MPSLNNTTWKCDSCEKERLNKDISVLTYSIDNSPYMSRNFKYCNDNPDCINYARKKASTGKI